MHIFHLAFDGLEQLVVSVNKSSTERKEREKGSQRLVVGHGKCLQRMNVICR